MELLTLCAHVGGVAAPVSTLACMDYARLLRIYADVPVEQVGELHVHCGRDACSGTGAGVVRVPCAEGMTALYVMRSMEMVCALV